MKGTRLLVSDFKSWFAGYCEAVESQGLTPTEKQWNYIKEQVEKLEDSDKVKEVVIKIDNPFAFSVPSDPNCAPVVRGVRTNYGRQQIVKAVEEDMVNNGTLRQNVENR